MNYYKHHIGDYASATEHLSWDEDLAYTRLLRVYYRDERPIPADVGQACRLVRATTPAQRKAVEAVLKEFFEPTPTGWHQRRCDAELAATHEKAERNRDVGRKGGRPVTQTEPRRNPDGFPQEPPGNPSHKPIANSHKPEKKDNALRALDGVDPQVVSDWTTHRKGRRAAITETAVEGIRKEAAKAGLTLEQALRICCQRGWTGFKAEWVAEEKTGIAAVLPNIAAKRDFIDMEAPHAPRLMG